jgi:predicted dehydrogenase
VIRSAAPHAKIMVFRHGPVTGHSEFADFTTSFLDDVQSFQPGLAVLASPASLHAEMARRLIAIGCDLLIEKPLASKLEDGRIIFAAAQTTGSTVQVGYNLRYLPSLRFFRDQIHQGCIGRVFSIRCEVGQSLESWRAGVDYRQGVGRIDWVGAWLGTQSDLEIDVEDTAHLVLGFRSGEALPPVASVSLDFIRHDITRRCIVIGEKGSLNWDAVKGTVEAFLKGDTEWQVLHQSNPEQDFSYTAQWQGFVGAVARPNGRPDPVAADLEQALHVLEVVEAARNSCDQNGIRMRLPVRERHGQ